MRTAAATALGNMGAFGFYDDVDAHTQPTSENNADVRAAAREACGRLLSAGIPTQLQYAADTLEKRQEYDRAIEAYKKMVEKLRQLNNDNRTLALYQQKIGELYLQKKMNDPQNAIPHLLEALTYFQKQEHAKQNITVPIISALLKAYLSLDQFDAALDFGASKFRLDPGTQSTVGCRRVVGWARRSDWVINQRHRRKRSPAPDVWPPWLVTRKSLVSSTSMTIRLIDFRICFHSFRPSPQPIPPIKLALDGLQWVGFCRLLKRRLTIAAASACPAWLDAVVVAAPGAIERSVHLHAQIHDLPELQLKQRRKDFELSHLTRNLQRSCQIWTYSVPCARASACAPVRRPR